MHQQFSETTTSITMVPGLPLRYAGRGSLPGGIQTSCYHDDWLESCANMIVNYKLKAHGSFGG